MLDAVLNPPQHPAAPLNKIRNTVFAAAISSALVTIFTPVKNNPRELQAAAFTLLTTFAVYAVIRHFAAKKFTSMSVESRKNFEAPHTSEFTKGAITGAVLASYITHLTLPILKQLGATSKTHDLTVFSILLVTALSSITLFSIASLFNEQLINGPSEPKPPLATPSSAAAMPETQASAPTTRKSVSFETP